MKIGITGATGQLGSLVLEELIKKQGTSNLVALVRSPEKVQEVEARAFDYEKPEDLAASLEGIDKLLLISGNEIGKRASQHKNVIDAAKKAGVQWIVYTSILKADTSTISLAGEHLITEKLLHESGITFTLLRNGWYTENYMGSVGGAIASGAFIGSAENGNISSASRQDFAEAAAIVLTDEKHKGKVYELAGDDSFTLEDLAKEISKQTGKEIPYKNLPEAEYSQALKSFGLPEAYADGIASWDVSASKGDLYDDSKTLSSLLGHPTTPLSESVKAILN